MLDDITVKEGYVCGGWREPINVWSELPGSIHADGVAQKVGMRGGTIPGTIHLNLFPPLLIEVFGQEWFEKGSLSMYYTYATMHREKVRAVIASPPEGAKDIQVEARVETPDGKIVARGSVSVGDSSEPTYLSTVELRHAEPGELRILEGHRAGDEMPPHEVLITLEDEDKVLETITDPLDWYQGDSPWGGPILYPAAMYHALMLTPRIPEGKTIDAVGFFGATEIRNINGPIKVGTAYQAKGKLTCVGASPKTEFFWYDSSLEDKETGKRVAEMRKLTRFMKASSPLY